MTSRDRAAKQARRLLARYLKLAAGLRLEAGSRPVLVPPMPGVDEDMRHWSFYMVLEHNCIVNTSISATVRQLAGGEPLSGAAAIDPKTGVMPSPAAGESQVRQLQKSVEDHLKLLPTLGTLRGTRTTPHTHFGDFDAHKWNCMFSFHMRIHLRQAETIVRTVEAAPARL